MKKYLFAIVIPVLMAVFITSCSNEDLAENVEEQNKEKLAEIHQFLDKYKDYWAPDENYTDEQRDSMMLKAGIDSIRQLFENLDNYFEWEFEVSNENNAENNSRAELSMFKIYGYHKCVFANTETTMDIVVNSSNKVRVVKADLKSNPSSQWRPEEPYPASKVVEEGKKWMVGATGIVLIYGVKKRFGMEGYVEKVSNTIGYTGKITRCRDIKMQS